MLTILIKSSGRVIDALPKVVGDRVMFCNVNNHYETYPKVDCFSLPDFKSIACPFDNGMYLVPRSDGRSCWINQAPIWLAERGIYAYTTGEELYDLAGHALDKTNGVKLHLPPARTIELIYDFNQQRIREKERKEEDGVKYITLMRFI